MLEQHYTVCVIFMMRYTVPAIWDMHAAHSGILWLTGRIVSEWINKYISLNNAC